LLVAGGGGGGTCRPLKVLHLLSPSSLLQEKRREEELWSYVTSKIVKLLVEDGYIGVVFCFSDEAERVKGVHDDVWGGVRDVVVKIIKSFPFQAYVGKLHLLLI
jgi:hypothetical protein